MFRTRCLIGLYAMAFACTASAADLTLGEAVEGRTKGDGPAVYEFVAESPGVLTVVVRGEDDVVLKVVNSLGRPLEGGEIDTDFGGDPGAEQGAIIIGQPGEYAVQVEPFGFSAVKFVLGSSWLPMEAVAREPDPHGSPEDAIALEVGKNFEEVIEAANGDREDWYRFEVESDGLLNVATRSESGDLVLESFAEDELGQALERSDSDIGGDTGRESITVDAEEGEVYYFRVTGFGGDAVYSIRAALTRN